MKNLNKLGFILSVGTLSALSFSLGACSDDPETSGGSAGSSGSGAGTPSTAGNGGSSAGTPSTAGNGGSSAGKGGSTAGSGGATAGAGGSTAGSGGATAGGGAGGATGGGGAGGGGGGAPSAACSMWCSGDDGLPDKCMGHELLNPVVDSEQKCLDYCAKPAAAAGLACWQKHLDFINGPGDQAPHCGHASGFGDDKGECAAITP